MIGYWPGDMMVAPTVRLQRFDSEEEAWVDSRQRRYPMRYVGTVLLMGVSSEIFDVDTGICRSASDTRIHPSDLEALHRAADIMGGMAEAQYIRSSERFTDDEDAAPCAP